MKKILYFFLTIFLFIFIFVSKISAQTPGQILDQAKEKAGGLSSQMNFKTGDYVEINKDVSGDLHIAGGEIGVFSRVKGDLLILGGKVLVDGEVDQDLRVLGGEVIVRGKIGRNATILGGKVDVEKTAQIAGGLLAAGGEVSVDRKAQIVGQKIVRSVPKDSLAKGKKAEKFSRFLKRISALTIIIKWISILIIGFLLIKFFPKTIKRLMEEAEKKFGEKLLKGTILAIVAPVIALFAIFSIIGASVGILILVVLTIGWYVAKLLAIAFTGYFLLHKASDKKFKIFDEKPSLYTSFLVGLLVFIVLGMVPVFGWIAKLLLILACFGALYQEKLSIYKKVEK